GALSFNHLAASDERSRTLEYVKDVQIFLVKLRLSGFVATAGEYPIIVAILVEERCAFFEGRANFCAGKNFNSTRRRSTGGLAGKALIRVIHLRSADNRHRRRLYRRSCPEGCRGARQFHCRSGGKEMFVHDKECAQPVEIVDVSFSREIIGQVRNV